MIKFFKKGNNFAKKKDGFFLSINFYWRLAVLFIFLMALISAFFGYYFFRQINEELIKEEANAISPAETVKKERIEKVLEYFSLRKQKSDEILNSPAPIIDPSL